MDDLSLLREYAANNSERAFEELVSRRVGFVYSAALRQVRDPHLAEEITQAVFIILARKAARISHKTIFAGWLFKTTRFAALAQIRAEMKRTRQEKEFQMQTEFRSAATDEIWNQMSPLLDEALASLGETDRQAVLLRFFEHKSLAEVGNFLGIGEDTARKRISRALEKLHRHFSKRGVSSTTAMLAGAISTNSIQAAPVALAKSVTAVAIAKGAAASGSTLTLIKGALKIMAWTKAKMAVVAGVVVLLAAGTTTVVVEKIANPKLSATDLSWADNPKYWEIDFGDPDPKKAISTMQSSEMKFHKLLEELPPVLILRPTKFNTNLGLIESNEKIIGRGQSLVQILREAYDPPPMSSHVILPTGYLDEKLDLMLTLSNSPSSDEPRKALQEEIKNQFGLVAHLETVETNALILKTKHSSAPALQPTAGGLPSYPTRIFQNKISIKNQNLSGIAACFSALLKTHVDNQTGIEEENRYDVTLEFQTRAGETQQDALKRIALDQLGLVFIPTNMPMKMLIVEKEE
ncbi:MAG TPA: sigma-70 family RNA polymerase sigma factor [Verrucomicrobiae bacterium]